MTAIKPNITAMHHVSLLVTDLEAARHFYHEVLGLAVDTSRPQMDFSGLWLQVGEQQIHLLSLGQTMRGTGAAHPGRDAHFAMRVADLGPVKQRLQRAGIEYTLSRSGRRALFCRDPDGNGIELIES